MNFLTKKIENLFLKYVWLTPAGLPLAEALGRTVFYGLLTIYIAFALVVFFSRLKDVWISRLFFPIVALLMAFSVGMFYAEDLGRAFHSWQKYVFISLVIPLTIFSLKKNEKGWMKFLVALTVTGALLPLFLVLKSGVATGWEQWVLPRSLIERNLPFLLPVVFLAIIKLPWGWFRWPIGLGYLAVCFVIVSYSGGRAALMALMVSLFLFMILVMQVKARLVLPAIVLMGIFSFVLVGQNLHRDLPAQQGYFEFLDFFTSGRTILWRQAIQNPPDSLFFGVGMGNARFYESVMTIHDFQVKHLHNFIFDAWYETGFLGLFLLLLVWASLIAPVFKKIKKFGSGIRIDVMTLLCSVGALLCGGLFSYSYISPQLTIYLYFILSGLFFVSVYQEGQEEKSLES